MAFEGAKPPLHPLIPSDDAPPGVTA